MADLNGSRLGRTVALMCRCPTYPAEALPGQLRVTGWQTENIQEFYWWNNRLNGFSWYCVCKKQNKTTIVTCILVGTQTEMVRVRASDQGEKSCTRELYCSREEVKKIVLRDWRYRLTKKKICLIRESGYNNSNMNYEWKYEHMNYAHTVKYDL